jgi:hypothetical protein
MAVLPSTNARRTSSEVPRVGRLHDAQRHQRSDDRDEKARNCVRNVAAAAICAAEAGVWDREQQPEEEGVQQHERAAVAPFLGRKPRSALQCVPKHMHAVYRKAPSLTFRRMIFGKASAAVWGFAMVAVSRLSHHYGRHSPSVRPASGATKSDVVIT